MFTFPVAGTLLVPPRKIMIFIGVIGQRYYPVSKYGIGWWIVSLHIGTDRGHLGAIIYLIWE